MTDAQETKVRHYQIVLDVEIRDQDDLVHFSPNTVMADMPELGLQWVGGTDGEALRNFFHFFFRGDFVDDWKKFIAGEHAIAAKALAEQKDA